MAQREEQELMMRFQIYEQQINQIQQQLKMIGENTEELNSLSLGLEELKDSDGKEIMASVGRGIFVKAKIISDELSVDIGGKNFVKKNVEETRKLIKKQTDKLDELKQRLEETLEGMNEELTKLMIDAQNRQKEKKDVKD